eukprot:10838139-Alexandrium_andersonii.AAC.1
MALLTPTAATVETLSGSSFQASFHAAASSWRGKILVSNSFKQLQTASSSLKQLPATSRRFTQLQAAPSSNFKQL